MKRYYLKLSAILIPAILAVSCETTRSRSSSSSYKTLHVHQTNGEDVITELNRDRWVQIRKTTKSDHTKLYAGLGAREWDVAIADSRAYLADHPGDFVALRVLSTALAMKQNFSLANYYAQMIEKSHPGQAETYNIQGLATLNKPGASFADFKMAAGHFERAFETDQSQVASGLNLGHLHLESGNAQAAKDVFGAVAVRCKSCSAALYGQGLAATRLRQYPAAKSYFEKILASDSNNLKASYNLALVENYGFKDPKRAIAILAKVLENKSDGSLAVKRQANFLKRRLEAQVYAEKTTRDLDEQAPIQNEPKKVVEEKLPESDDLSAIETSSL